MKNERFTHKAQEALQDAHRTAMERQHPELHPEHLALALLDQEGGIAGAVLEKAGESPAALREKVLDNLAQMPQSSGDARISTRFQKLLGEAEKIAKKWNDDYISLEHLLLAIARDLNLDDGRIEKAIKEVRGSRRVDSPTA